MLISSIQREKSLPPFVPSLLSLTASVESKTLPIGKLAEQPRLLLAEDDVILRKLLTKILESAGYRVVSVMNGAEAVLAFQQQPIDLVLLDVMMPIMDGLGACTKIRGLSNVPIVMLSAFSSKDVVARAERNGASLFLHKPIRPTELKHHIQALLQMPRYLEMDINA
jgi:CheY-like chemotaxis protein